MARLFAAALAQAGVAIEPAPPLRTYDPRGDAERQQRLADLGARLAERLIGRLRTRPAEQRPDLWFTYHVYHKAPDHLGPAVSAALGIPYVIAEASRAPRQRAGPWAIGFAAAEAAIRRADRILALNSTDTECLRAVVPAERIVAFPPFIDAAPFRAAARTRASRRRALATRYGLDPTEAWLLCVAMMRAGDKLASYRVLADALARVRNRRWRLLIAGDGPARADAMRALAPLGPRTLPLGRLDAADLCRLYAACDLYVWPAVREAFGIAFLEAQAAGLPVVAGRTGGVPDVVAAGGSGLLVPVGESAPFARAVDRLLAAPETRRTMGRRAAARVMTHHDRPVAARRMAAILSEACGRV